MAERRGDPTGKDFKVGDPRVDNSRLIAQNIQRFITDKIGRTDDQAGTILREKQLGVFIDIAKFFSSPDDKRGSVILPTGSGKTVIMAELANAMYYGMEGSVNRPKTLLLVPKIDLIDQTIGKRDSEGKPIGGFMKFAPDVTTSKYGGGKQDLSGDVVVMTYQSLERAVKAGKPLPQFDVVLADEAHRSIGAETKKAVDAVTTHAKTVAFTATPDFSATKTVREIYGKVLREMDLREAIDLGILSPAQVWHYKTNVELNVPTRDGEFLDEELQTLIDNEGRNRAAIDLTANYVAQGLQGVISCLPGGGTRHATDMATRLNKTEIIDKKGVKRNIVAKSVAGTMEPAEREKIYEEYRLGLIDVLTYVDLLTEGWDAPNAKFLINLRPTKSPVNAIQRLGRVLRLYQPDSIAQIVEFVDNIRGANTYTALHALGEEEMPLNTGIIFGRDTRAIPDGDTEDSELFIPDMEKVRGLIDSCRLELLAELYVSSVERDRLAQIKTGELMTLRQAVELIEASGGQLSLTSLANQIPERVKIGREEYVTWEQVQAALDYYVARPEDITTNDVALMVARRLGDREGREMYVSNSSVDMLLSPFPESGRTVKLPGSRVVSKAWDKNKIEAILDKVLEPFDDQYIKLYDFYHDDNGRRAGYKKDRFTALSRTAPKLLAENIDLPERLEAVRVAIGLYDRPELVFKKDVLDRVLGDSKQEYLGK